MFNIIFKKEDIPQQWLNGILININKGNCNPELLTNKRGISLTSNVGKVFERILNARVIQNLPFSDAQAGGRPNRSTVDQIFALKEVVKQRSSEIKPTYCAFIDIKKAYDKAWRFMGLWN